MASKNQIKIFALMFLTLSMIFTIPYNIGEVYGADDALGRGDSATKGEVADTCNLVPPTNPKDSLVMSFVTLCLPGVLEKAKEWKEIKCEEVVCSYEAVKNSLDPSFCAKESDYKVCTYVVGEAFAIPPMSVFEDIKDLVASIIANPAGIMYSVGIGLLRKNVEKITCDAPISFGSVVLGLNDIAAGAQQISDIAANGFSYIKPHEEIEDSCDKVDDIVEELETIVDATDSGSQNDSQS